MTPSNPSPASSNEPEAAEVSDGQLDDLIRVAEGRELEGRKEGLGQIARDLRSSTLAALRELKRLRSRPVAEVVSACCKAVMTPSGICAQCQEQTESDSVPDTPDHGELAALDVYAGIARDQGDKIGERRLRAIAARLEGGEQLRTRPVSAGASDDEINAIHAGANALAGKSSLNAANEERWHKKCLTLRSLAARLREGAK
jgi:hypothetical protein